MNESVKVYRALRWNDILSRLYFCVIPRIPSIDTRSATSPDQYKALTEDEWMWKQKCFIVWKTSYIVFLLSQNLIGRLYAISCGSSAGSWECSGSAYQSWHQGKGSPPCTAHSSTQRWHPHCRCASAEWPQSWCTKQGLCVCVCIFATSLCLSHDFKTCQIKFFPVCNKILYYICCIWFNFPWLLADRLHTAPHCSTLWECEHCPAADKQRSQCELHSQGIFLESIT